MLRRLAVVTVLVSAFAACSMPAGNETQQNAAAAGGSTGSIPDQPEGPRSDAAPTTGWQIHSADRAIAGGGAG
jgi:hypothetical protein